MNKKYKALAKEYNNKIMPILIAIVTVVIIIVGTWFSVLYIKNCKIAGIWKSVDSTVQYQFSPYGKYKYYEDISNKKCDLWNCNYKEGSYEIKDNKNTSTLVLHINNMGTYSTEFRLENGYLTLLDGKVKLKKSN
jgi:hypothetical protein